MDETCGCCKFFRRMAPLQPAGTCHAVPPTAILIGRNQLNAPVVNSFWPITADTEFCGAFKERATDRAVALEHIDLTKLDVEELEGSA